MMKKLLVCVVLMFPVTAASAAMSRVVEIRDSRTIVVATNGRVETIALCDVRLFPQEEQAATAFLRQTLSDKWVYIEGGDVWRSPDALYVNDAMRRRAWLRMTYLGQLDVDPAPKKVTPSPSAEPKKRASPPKRARRR
jgi:hypothetical protein